MRNFFHTLSRVVLFLVASVWMCHTNAKADTQYAHVMNMGKAGAKAAFGEGRIDISIDDATPHSDSTLNARFVDIQSSMDEKSNYLNINIQRGSKNIVGIGWGGDDDVVTNIRIRNIANFPAINAKKKGGDWADAADDNPSSIVWTNDRTSMVMMLNDKAYEKPNGWGHNTGYYFKVFPWKPTDTIVNVTFDLYLYGDSKKYYTGKSPGEEWHRKKLKTYYEKLNRSKIDNPDWVRGVFFWTLLGDIESFLPLIDIQTIDGISKEGTTDTGVIRVTRADNPQLPLSVNGTWVTSPANQDNVVVSMNGTAVGKAFTINFLPGQLTQDLIVKSSKRDVFETGKRLIVSLSGSPNYKLRSSSASVDIIAAPPLATIVSSQPSAHLPNTPGEFKIDMDTIATVPITVRYSVGGTAPPKVRYQALPGTITFLPGQRSLRVPVVPIQNYVVTPTQTVIATLVPGTNYEVGGSLSATVNIFDNNDNVFSIVTNNATATPKGAPAIFRVIRAGNNLAPISLDWKMTGTASPSLNYTPALPPSVVFGEGVREVTFTINAVTASAPPDRSLIITLQPAPRYTLGNSASTTLTIISRKPVTHVDINATIFSGATTPANAVDSWVPDGVTVKGGIIALGNGDVPESTMPATLVPQLEYLNGTWIPPVVPYGIDIRIKRLTLDAQ